MISSFHFAVHAELTTMKEFPQPFYWAAYQLTGEP